MDDVRIYKKHYIDIKGRFNTEEYQKRISSVKKDLKTRAKYRKGNWVVREYDYDDHYIVSLEETT